MDTTFLRTVLPPHGPYCVLGIRGKEGQRIQTFHDTIDAVAEQAERLNNDGLNAYFALARFTEGVASREAQYAVSAQSFFVDLDCGEKKPYATQDDAIAALQQFVTATAFPEPCVVNSGHGVHAYWPLDEEVVAEKWLVIAQAFKRFCLVNGLQIDRTATSDIARVLRVPDTLNTKTAPAVPVSVLELSERMSLKAFVAQLPIQQQTSVAHLAGAPRGVDTLTQQLAGGDYPQTSFVRLVRKSMAGTGCAQIANAIEGAVTLEEPLWRAALSIAWRCTDKDTAIHKLSAMHPDYNPEETLRKAELTRGPMTCAWYKENYPEHCSGCTHSITSPIQLGRQVEEAPPTETGEYVVAAPHPVVGQAQYVIPPFQRPFFRGLHGGVYMRTKTKDGEPEEVEVYPYDLYLTSRYYDSTESGDGEGELVEVHLHTPQDGVRIFVSPVATLLVREKMRDLMLKHGVFAINKQLDLLMAYFASAIRGLQKSVAASRTRNQMGWTSDHTGFVVGEIEYTATGKRIAPAGLASRIIAPHLTPKGSLVDWSRIANFYGRPGMEMHAIAICAGFAAPLLRLVGGMDVRGAAINLMSNKSGTGKTTAQMVVNSIWGHPKELLLSKKDTVLSKMQYIGLMNSMAVTMDEITNMSDEEVSELIYDIPQGRGRHRMDSQANKLRANQTSWCTIVIMSSNASAYDKLTRLKDTADGEMRRLIELRITRPIEVSKAESDAVFRQLLNNYGVAGPKFIEYVLQNQEAVIDQFNVLQAHLDKDLQLDQSDRYYSKVSACILAGGQIANQLGLINYDLDALYVTLKKVLRGIKDEVLNTVDDFDAVAQEGLTSFVNENINNTLVVDSIGVDNLPPIPIQHPRGPLRMRYEPDTQELWIPSALLRDFFVTRQVDYRMAIQSLKSLGILKYKGVIMTKRIGAGAIGNYSATSVRCFCVSGQAIGLQSYEDRN